MLHLLSKADRTADLFVRWGSLYLMVATALGWIAKNAPWFGQLNWAELTLLAVFGALILVFLIAASLAMFRYFRPLSNGASPVTAASVSVLDHTEIDQLRSDVTYLKAEVEPAKEGKESLRAGIQSFMAAALSMSTELYERLKAEVEKQVQELIALKTKQKTIIEDYQTVLGKQAQLAADLKEIRGACAGLEETVKKNDENVRQSFSAVFARERLAELAATIELDAGDLYKRLNEGEHYTAQGWDRWVNVHHHWESTINQWIDQGRWYAKDVKDTILTIDDREYDQHWTVRDEQFPNADAVWRFKRHRIIQGHWEEMKERVNKGAELVAFSGLTERDQHGGQFHQ